MKKGSREKLAAQRLSLGEFVATSNAAVGIDAGAANPPPGEQDPQAEDTDERMRTVYRMLAPRPGDLVNLADVRELVAELTPADVDAALRRLHRRRGVTLVPEANQKTLDARTRAAAVVIGEQPKHSNAMEVS